MAQEINNSTTLPDATMKAEIAALGIPTTLTHMVDYTLNKEGLMILSRWFLLRRGHCCQNGCQYCPY